MRLFAISVMAATLMCLGMAAAASAPMSYEDRVDGQDALERVFYYHQIWPEDNPGPRPLFEDAVSRSVLESKVQRALAASEALEAYWQRPLTGEQIQAEIDRMAAHSKAPDTLMELYASLEFDPDRIAECLARPALAKRLARQWYSMDERFHGDLRGEAERLREILTNENFAVLGGERLQLLHLRVDTVEAAISQAGIALDEDSFHRIVSGFPRAGKISDVVETPQTFTIRHTLRRSDHELEAEVIVFEKRPFDAWLSDEMAAGLGSRVVAPAFDYRLPHPRQESMLTQAPDTWSLLDAAPTPRYSHTAVWTGSEVIVWGGLDGVKLNSGGRYHPATDTWTPTNRADTDLPDARYGHTAVWTGTEMVIWGGFIGSGSTNRTNTGARYNPTLDTGSAGDDPWSPTAIDGGTPTGRVDHTAVWSGSQMMVWGGQDGGTSVVETGARYDPSQDWWIPMATGGSKRRNHGAVWTGERMIIWGGEDPWGPGPLDTGAIYDPSQDTWTTMSAAGPPAARYDHTAVWTGTEMIVWGGAPTTTTGGRFNLLANTWTATSTSGACPAGRRNHTGIWTGENMIIWGGQGSSPQLDTGGVYDPVNNTWASTTTSNCPAARRAHTAVWTGTEMIVWGGTRGTGPYNNGGRYDPIADSWVPMEAPVAMPTHRDSHSLVWIGAKMVVWGGYGCIDGDCSAESLLDSGSVYIPSMDYWDLTQITGTPSARRNHTAVWTGREMVIWGGVDGSAIQLNTGAVYDPLSDAWPSATSLTNAPFARTAHTALWSGTEMLVWGGAVGGGFYTDTGARWTPSASPGPGSWTAMAAPPGGCRPRGYHSAVWTGSEMIVWGGRDCTEYIMCETDEVLNSGARYSPSGDGWNTLPTLNAPTARDTHSGVWGNSEMIVWGGFGGAGYLNDGGRYHPGRDEWAASAIAATNAPSPRSDHTAVWTGYEMIVWGGRGYYDAPEDIYKHTGARYRLGASEWTPLPLENVPMGRRNAPAAWTGESMILWDGAPFSQSGGIFYPNTPPRAKAWMTVDYGASGSAGTASYHAGYQCPACTSIGRSCHSDSLLHGRGNMSGGAESNEPNTLYSSCPDGDAGSYGTDENIEYIYVYTNDSVALEMGREVTMEVRIIAYGSSNRLHFFYAQDASDPEWNLIDSQNAPGPGMKDLTTTFTLKAGTVQAVRAVLEYQGYPYHCVPGDSNDHDDLVFAVRNPSGGTVYNLGSPGDTLTLIGSDSSEGSNSWAEPRYHDAFDSIVSYEWDLHGDAEWGTDCETSVIGADFNGEVVTVIQDDLAYLGIDYPHVQDVWLRVTDTLGRKGCAYGPLTIRDGTSPTIDIVTPQGGTVWEYSGDPGDRVSHLITWNADDDFGIVRTWIEYTTDSGATWTCIADSDDPPGCPADGEVGSDWLLATDQNFLWTMPTATEASADGQTFPSSQARVRVTVEDVSGNQTTAYSSGLFYIVQPTTTAVRTLILSHSNRIDIYHPPAGSAVLWSKLNDLAAHTKVNGVILDLATHPMSDPGGVYEAWDSNPEDIARANAVADAIRDYVVGLVETTYTNAEYIVLAGDDRIIPHYRVADGTTVYPESNYCAEMPPGTPLGEALCNDFYLTDSIFGDLEYDTPVVGVNFLALPDLAVGRLVETPLEMGDTISLFIAQDGQVDLDSVLVTGYDFLEDSAWDIYGDYDAAVPDARELIGDLWEAVDLDKQLFLDPSMLVNVNDHTTHFAFGSPAGGDLITYDMEADHPGQALQNGLMYVVGCHSGFHAPDAQFSGLRELDLPQFMLQKGIVAYVGNTGFGWGLNYGVGYSEKLMEYITQELLSDPAPVLGKALNEAKRLYYLEDHRYDVFDEKVLFESTLYGLPMYSLVMDPAKVAPKRRLLAAEGPDHQEIGGISMRKALNAGEGGRALPPGVTELSLSFDFSAAYDAVNNTIDGDYYSLNGIVGAEAGDVIQPMFLYDSQLSGTTNHGVLYTGGTFGMFGSFDPVVGVPQSSNPAGSEGPIGPSAGSFIPTVSRTRKDGAVSKAASQELNRMTVFTGYYDGDENGPGVETRFDTMDFVIYYSNSSDEDGPTITDPDPDPANPQPDVYTLHTMNGLTAEFSVEAADASGVYRVVVVYTDGQASWQSIDLVYNGTSAMWEGSLDLYRSIRYHVQAVDSAGNVGFLTKDGSDQAGGGGDYGSTFSAARIFEAILADDDVDYDGLLNSEEAVENTDPLNADTDGDGENDGSEAHNFKDPLDPSDGERITITTTLINGGNDIQIDWPSALGHNAAIDGPYWIYRSTDVSFDAAEILVTTPYPIPDGTEKYIDAGAGADPETYYYTVVNARYLGPAPVVNVVFPASGSEAGGTSVTIYGDNFAEGASVRFGSSLASAVTVVNATTIECTTPPGTGTLNVIVTNLNGQFGEKTSGFTYTP